MPSARPTRYQPSTVVNLVISATNTTVHRCSTRPETRWRCSCSRLQLIAARDTFASKRQVFFGLCSAGFDTHTRPIEYPGHLLTQVMTRQTFYDATVASAFRTRSPRSPLSDFAAPSAFRGGRRLLITLSNHHFVMGGGAKGGATPAPSRQPLPGSSAARVASCRRPSVVINAAPLASWSGVSDADEHRVCPTPPRSGEEPHFVGGDDRSALTAGPAGESVRARRRRHSGPLLAALRASAYGARAGAGTPSRSAAYRDQGLGCAWRRRRRRPSRRTTTRNSWPISRAARHRGRTNPPRSRNARR